MATKGSKPKTAKPSEQKQKGHEDPDIADESNPTLKNLRIQHKEAQKRLSQIKNQLKNLEIEQKELEMESYVKARHMSKQFEKRDEEILKEYGKRLKEIQSRQREIETTIKNLIEEKNRITY
jgi:hypothetical protein